MKTPAAFNALKVPIAVLGLAGVALAAYYFLYVTGEQEYLTARNFRLLATMGEQINLAIENDRQVLINLRKDRKADKQFEALFGIERDLVSNFIPILRSAEMAWSGPKAAAAEASSSPVLLKFVERQSRLQWLRRDERLSAEKRAAIVRLDLDDLLTPFLGGELQTGVFDAVLVAANDGRVIFQTGDRKLRITRVDKLEVDSKPARELNFAQVARSSAMVDVRLSGSRYKLLMQPCCDRMVRDGSPPDASEGWVLCGLTAQRTLAAASSAVSFSMMALLMGLLLLGVFTWPFLKLMFIGEAQRVRAHDVVLVGLGALLGIALITVSTLDLYAFHRLQAVLDDQLKRFATSIKSQAQQEVTAAYSELTRLEPAVAKLIDAPVATELAGKDELFDEGYFDRYPFFESLAFLDSRGEQKRKLAFDSFATPLIDVSRREYFTYWKPPRSTPAFLQPLQSATTGAREAVLSKPSSVEPFKVTTLAIPLHALIDPVTVPGFGFVVINQDGRVLFHSDPHHNLSENFFVESDGSRRLKALVSARHEEWLDTKYWGDDHRAFVTPMEITLEDPPRLPVARLDEPWTLVTFYDQDLARMVNVESLVIVVVLLILYSGVYVMICLGVLLLRPKYRAPWLWPDPSRSRAYLDLLPSLLILTATFATAIFALAPGDLIAAAALLPFLAWVLTYRALAPRAERGRLTWAGAAGLSALVWVLAAVVRAGVLGWRGVLVALLGGAAAWASAAVRRHTVHRLSPLSPPVNSSYGFAAGLLLFLIAVLPAAAFFKAASDTEIENFIKYGQLQTALDRIDHESRLNDIVAKRITDPKTAERVLKLRDKHPKWWGGYETFFFCTQPRHSKADQQVAEHPECRRIDAAVDQAATSNVPATVPAIVEELLPFYSEASVGLRELVHDRAADQSWSWARSGAHLVLRMGPANVPTLVSVKPSFFEWPVAGESSFSSVVFLALIAIAVIGAVVWVVRFLIHTVFVVDVIEPLWSGTDEALRGPWRPHLFILGGEPRNDQRLASTYAQVDFTDAPSDESGESQWFGDQIDRLAKSPAAQDVLFLHFERRLPDRAFNERKLALVERAVKVLNRTVVIISAAPPGVFFAVSEAARDEHDVDSSRRWANLLSGFTVIPADPIALAQPPVVATAPVLTGGAAGGWREIVWRLNALGFAHRAHFLEDERRDPVVGRVWKDVLPYAWHPDRPALDVAQLLVEVGERAESYYREIWATCTPAEKLVLGQLAEEGLVNEKTKRTVRLLMARGLVRRQPHFVLMNETFRQFVLSPSVRTEVDALEEHSSGTWDVIRLPLLIVLLASLSFFFATQQELFKTVLGVLTAAATVVPTIVKMASVLGDRRSAA